jgi:hypothetical protein
MHLPFSVFEGLFDISKKLREFFEVATTSFFRRFGAFVMIDILLFLWWMIAMELSPIPFVYYASRITIGW